MSTATSDTRPLYDCVQILDVVLRESNAWTNLFPNNVADKLPKLELVQDVKVERHNEIVVAIADLSVIGIDQDSEDEVLKLSASYAVIYHCDPSRQTTLEELKQFGGSTAIFNVWPFWRELASSYYARMKLPFPVLPSLSPNLGLVLGPRDPEGAEE